MDGAVNASSWFEYGSHDKVAHPYANVAGGLWTIPGLTRDRYSSAPIAPRVHGAATGVKQSEA